MNFEILELEYNNRDEDLIIKANSQVSSLKTFPLYNVDGQKMLFKPLSYTKPLTTPFFAYAEVFWSIILNRYFDDNNPIYSLAYCTHLTDAYPKYYSKGTLVALQERQGCKIMNLYDYFVLYPDENVNIKDYINYCGVTYDYTNILKAKIFQKNISLLQKLSYHILLSILKLDYNFHYENILLYVKDEQVVDLVPMLDHEFSLYFLFPDTNQYMDLFQKYFDDIFLKEGTCYRNITYIKQFLPEIYQLFIEKIKLFKKDINDLYISFDKKYVGMFSTRSWLVGDARYKQHDDKKAKEYEKNVIYVDANEYNFDGWNSRLKASLNIIIDTLLKMK